MHKPIIWTQETDAKIISMRAARLSWDHIALQLNVARYTASERGRVIGALAPPKSANLSRGDDRQPLPAGSVETWGAITDGTCLTGAVYPAPTPLAIRIITKEAA